MYRHCLRCCLLSSLRACSQGPGTQELLEPHREVRTWMKRVAERTAPHYEEVTALMRTAAKRFKEDRDKQVAQTSSKL